MNDHDADSRVSFTLPELAAALHRARINCWQSPSWQDDGPGCLEVYSEHNIPNPGDEWSGSMHDKEAEAILSALHAAR